MRVLFATSEVWPLVKTGGLGDVSYSLPHALMDQGADVRLVIPAYRSVLEKVESFEVLGWSSFYLAGQLQQVRILEASHPQFKMPLWLIDSQNHFDREGNPYLHADGYDWPDNAERFVLFSKAVAQLGVDAMNTGWKPDVVHANDWQTGMVPTLLDEEPERPRRVFTIHNMAYGGYFSHEEYNRLHLPWHHWSAEGVEFYGNLSMLKAGMVYADAITTVSPTYADEICTPAFGYGMEGVLSSRRYKLSGILNGIDTQVWNPASDEYIPHHYSAKRRNPGKKNNKKALLESFGAEVTDAMLEAPLLGMVSRLVEQKGIDMVVDSVPHLLAHTDANFVLIGTGHAYFESRLQMLADEYPERVFVLIGYDEARSHLLEAGSDIFLMPSRFEPCGLNQMYSLRYGTIPLVHRTGGLADTVVNVFDQAGNFNPDGNGFVFDTPDSIHLSRTIEQALDLYKDKKQWHALQRNAMNEDYSWARSAQAYLNIYKHEMTD